MRATAAHAYSAAESSVYDSLRHFPGAPVPDGDHVFAGRAGAVLDQIADAAGDPAPAMPAQRDQGTVFRIDEIAEVFARSRQIEDLSFEVQVWDPSVLPPPIPSRLPTAKL